MESRLNAFKDVLVGFIVGVTSMLPGISGATMLVVFGLYERLIRDLAKLREYLRKDIGFILLIVIGFAVGTLLCAKVLDHALDEYPVEALMFFLGLILGQLPVLLNAVRTDVKIENKGEYDRKCVLCFSIGLAIMIAMVLIDAFCHTGDVHISHDAGGLGIMFLVGIVVAVSALLPGLSHSTLLLVVGLMSTFTSAISDLDGLFIASMGIGAIIGLLGFSKVIHRALEEHHLWTMLLIVGLTVGSLFVIAWNIADNYTDLIDLAIGAVCLAVGIALSLLSTRFDTKKEIEELSS